MKWHSQHVPTQISSIFYNTRLLVVQGNSMSCEQTFDKALKRTLMAIITEDFIENDIRPSSFDKFCLTKCKIFY